MGNPLIAKQGTVTIRMYRAAFGDCFLLAFPGNNNRTRYLLIDCGVHHQFSGREELMKEIAAEIRKATDSRIDVLAVTHEHTDHILGFSVAKAEFEKMKIGSVWMGWTENYSSPKVKKLDKKKRQYLHGLQVAASLSEGRDRRFSEQLKGVLGFYGIEHLSARDAHKSKTMNTRQTMEWLQKRAENGPTFCTPGENPLTIDGVDGVNIFVLGPPTQERLLKKDLPSEGSRKETYLTDGAAELYDYFGNMMLSMQETRGGTSSPREGVSPPFAECYWKRSNPKSTGFTRDLYYKRDYDWRKIDDEWMDIAAELAIKMDSDTNNSSLVLAIELGKGGKVLLFPGDAQVGSWLSWHELEWNLVDRTVTTDDLLARTVVYKVGHHGSHNATLKEKGLERMPDFDLTALMPVDEDYAQSERGWPIPHEQLLARLYEKCRMRVLRTDVDDNCRKPREISSKQWQVFRKRVDANDKYIDYTVEWDSNPDHTV